MKVNGKTIGIGILSLFLFGAIGNAISSDTQENQTNEQKSSNTIKEKICDGINITEDCTLDGVQYSIYKYYPATEEQSHIETITTYKKEIVGYCTLCNDGTRSPSCSTGRGTCSHHGGVAQWNAPIYRDVPQYEQNKVIDSPATEEYYEKVVK